MGRPGCVDNFVSCLCVWAWRCSGVVLLLRQGGVSSVQESENSPRRESSSSMFQCGFKRCGIILSAVCLLTYTPQLLTLI